MPHSGGRTYTTGGPMYTPVRQHLSLGVVRTTCFSPSHGLFCKDNVQVSVTARAESHCTYVTHQGTICSWEDSDLLVYRKPSFLHAGRFGSS